MQIIIFLAVGSRDNILSLVLMIVGLSSVIVLGGFQLITLTSSGLLFRKKMFQKSFVKWSDINAISLYSFGQFRKINISVQSNSEVQEFIVHSNELAWLAEEVLKISPSRNSLSILMAEVETNKISNSTRLQIDEGQQIYNGKDTDCIAPKSLNFKKVSLGLFLLLSGMITTVASVTDNNSGAYIFFGLILAGISVLAKARK